MHAPDYLFLDDSIDTDSDPDDPPYFPKFHSLADGVASTSTNMKQSPPTKKRKPTKLVHKWKKADLNVQSISGGVTKLPILTNSEVKCFLGINFVSGYVLVTKRHMFWKQRVNSYNALISTAIRCDSFETIFSNLHVADIANIVPLNKFAKLPPHINKLNE
ncbi:chimeric ERCC6-PGBD3 protein [Trichonephila inaurata madagascariensis]|uniref:Chimeric ERCC6-PGBD3 protein n=1 Tax=Trichonephila inaurata madagascariensis TaxID=2747483 RepID=A0A8X6XEE4_9ARAC|nr:chimeric ERCC6-PGBD3 protein [Trichonephila inaurata madagascariensis]